MINVKTNAPEALPLTEATYYILLSLAQQPKHGYAIMKDVQDLSDRRVIFSTGTLYGAIKRLLQANWICRSASTNQPHPNRERKAYALTDAGRKILQAEYQRLSNLLQISRSRVKSQQA